MIFRRKRLSVSGSGLSLTRVVAGGGIGIAFGCVVGVVMFLITRPDLERHDSIIMINSAALGWLLVGGSVLVADACAVLVGLIVGIARLGKGTAAIIGFVVGLLPHVAGFIAFGSPGVPSSASEWIGLFVSIAVLPMGVALTAIVQTIAVQRL